MYEGRECYHWPDWKCPMSHTYFCNIAANGEVTTTWDATEAEGECRDCSNFKTKQDCIDGTDNPIARKLCFETCLDIGQ